MAAAMRTFLHHRLQHSRLLVRRLSRGAFSSDGSPPPTRTVFPSRTSLDLDATLIQPNLYSIRQLPEIHNALECREKVGNSAVNLEELERATKVFSSIQPGGHEHQASLALLAESQEPHAAIRTLEHLRHYHHHTPEQEFAVSISLAKTLWLHGDFAEAEAICSSLLQSDDDNSPLTALPPLYTACARSGQAIARICRAASLDDVFSVRDPFRMAIKTLEQQGGASLPLSLAQLNFGTAEALYAQIVAANHIHTNNNQDCPPLDAAMRAWKQGLTLVQRAKDASLLSRSIEAQLQTQMAWGLLQLSDDDGQQQDDNVKRASEFAGDALKIYDAHGITVDEDDGMRRTLSIIGTCFHKTGSAVTAQGIFQSAIDSKATRRLSVFDKTQLRESLTAYADLCQQWDKREGDADKFRSRALDVDASLPGAWKGKSGLYGTLWFWTPSLFVKST